jgi:enamine deaminase RidA (YjgF/YER057c/UK114 family)
MKMISPVPESAYSKAVMAKFGTLLFVSGQESIDENGKLLAPGDFTGQIQQVWKNLRTVLEKADDGAEKNFLWFRSTRRFRQTLTSFESSGPSLV